MDWETTLEVIFKIVGGLGIFLMGMKDMSEGLQAMAGARLRRMINSVTSNSVKACALGTAVTGIIQSSSLTTVMLVGMVNAGIMNLTQSIGVTLGADIGTTVTGWIFAIDLGKYGLPLVGVAAFFYLFSTKDRVRYTAMMVVGFGMIFFGLELMKDGILPIRESTSFQSWFYKFAPDNSFISVLKCCLVGIVVTSIIQSSSAAVGITMVLAEAGMVNYTAALALVLGENIGTTITAYLAALGASRNAKRVAYAHILIKVVGVIWVLPLFYQFEAISKGMAISIPQMHPILDWLVGTKLGDPSITAVKDGVMYYPYARGAIAVAHTGFNVANVAIFLFFVPNLARLLIRVFPDKPVKEVPHLTYLDVRMVDSPAISIEQSKNEILRMSEEAVRMMEWLRECMTDGNRDTERERRIFHREEILDVMQKEVVEFLSQVLSGNVPHDVMEAGRGQLRMADEYESISDYATNILKLNIKMRKDNLPMVEPGREAMLDLHDRTVDYVKMINDAVRDEVPEVLTKANSRGSEIVRLMKDYRAAHLARVMNDHLSPIMSLYYTDMLNAYRRIKDHAQNIAEVLAGEK